MRLYVMCRSVAWPKARTFMEDARAAGHSITEDWTLNAEALAGREGDLSPDAAWRIAANDVRGVDEAEACVFLADDGDYCGALIEYGYAVARLKTVFVVAPWRPSIFWHCPRTTILPDENAAREMLGMRVLDAVT
jgi:nucleoside 2-deoxyribosyltransferase